MFSFKNSLTCYSFHLFRVVQRWMLGIYYWWLLYTGLLRMQILNALRYTVFKLNDIYYPYICLFIHLIYSSIHPSYLSIFSSILSIQYSSILSIQYSSIHPSYISIFSSILLYLSIYFINLSFHITISISIQVLLKQGADPDSQSKLLTFNLSIYVSYLSTPLSIYTIYLTIQVLLKHGADPDAQSKFDKSPADISHDTGRPDLRDLLMVTLILYLRPRFGLVNLINTYLRLNICF